MAANNSSTAAPDVRFVVPDHIVRREFVEETVILNLKTGKYHGLNPTAAKMLDTLERTGTIAEAAAELADLYGQPPEVIREDLADLCEAMTERGFIEKVAPVDAHP